MKSLAFILFFLTFCAKAQNKRIDFFPKEDKKIVFELMGGFDFRNSKDFYNVFNPNFFGASTYSKQLKDVTGVLSYRKNGYTIGLKYRKLLIPFSEWDFLTDNSTYFIELYFRRFYRIDYLEVGKYITLGTKNQIGITLANGYSSEYKLELPKQYYKYEDEVKRKYNRFGKITNRAFSYIYCLNCEVNLVYKRKLNEYSNFNVSAGYRKVFTTHINRFFAVNFSLDTDLLYIRRKIKEKLK